MMAANEVHSSVRIRIDRHIYCPAMLPVSGEDPPHYSTSLMVCVAEIHHRKQSNIFISSFFTWAKSDVARNLLFRTLERNNKKIKIQKVHSVCRQVQAAAHTQRPIVMCAEQLTQICKTFLQLRMRTSSLLIFLFWLLSLVVVVGSFVCGCSPFSWLRRFALAHIMEQSNE